MTLSPCLLVMEDSCARAIELIRHTTSKTSTFFIFPNPLFVSGTTFWLIIYWILFLFKPLQPSQEFLILPANIQNLWIWKVWGIDFFLRSFMKCDFWESRRFKPQKYKKQFSRPSGRPNYLCFYSSTSYISSLTLGVSMSQPSRASRGLGTWARDILYSRRRPWCAA